MLWVCAFPLVDPDPQRVRKPCDPSIRAYLWLAAAGHNSHEEASPTACIKPTDPPAIGLPAPLPFKEKAAKDSRTPCMSIMTGQH